LAVSSHPPSIIWHYQTSVSSNVSESCFYRFTELFLAVTVFQKCLDTYISLISAKHDLTESATYRIEACLTVLLNKEELTAFTSRCMRRAMEVTSV
jgi:branched-subunit amino acid permease